MVGIKLLEGEGSALDVLEGRASWCIIGADALATLCDLPADIVDGVITDPPYSSGGMFRGDRTKSTGQKYVGKNIKLDRPSFGGDNRDQRSFSLWCSLWLAEARRIAKEETPIAVFSDWRQLPTMTDAIQAGGFIWRGVAVWEKLGARPFKGRFRQAAEFIIWGSAGRLPMERGVGFLPGVVAKGRDKESKRHQTGKPIDVMTWINSIVKPEGLILDPFAGSGSTGVAALKEGRRFIGIEQSPEYLEMARERLANAYKAKEGKSAA